MPDGSKVLRISSLAAQASPLYAALAPSERAELEARTVAANEAYAPVYQAWKDSLSLEQVALENQRRAKLRKLGLASQKNLKVDGAPKRPPSSYFLYVLSIVRPGLRLTRRCLRL